jgi:hypothetical protein
MGLGRRTKRVGFVAGPKGVGTVRVRTQEGRGPWLDPSGLGLESCPDPRGWGLVPSVTGPKRVGIGVRVRTQGVGVGFWVHVQTQRGWVVGSCLTQGG